MKQKEKAHHEAKTATMLMDYIQRGVALKDIKGVTNETMEEMYAHAYHFYSQGRLDEAENFFRVLCMYDLNNPEYFMGLGAVFQLRKDYEKACDWYALAFMLSKDDYRPMLYCGQCHLLSGNAARALQCFHDVFRDSKDDALKRKAEIYIKTIRENRPELEATDKQD